MTTEATATTGEAFEIGPFMVTAASIINEGFSGFAKPFMQGLLLGLFKATISRF